MQTTTDHMNYTLNVTGEQMQVIWNCLLEQPAKLTFPTLEAVKAQVAAQEQEAAKPSIATEVVHAEH